MDIVRRQNNSSRSSNLGLDLNQHRSTYPVSNNATKTYCAIQPRHFQPKESFIPLPLASRSTQLYSLEQNRFPPSQIVPSEEVRHCQDIEYITVPVLKARKSEPRLNVYHQEFPAAEKNYCQNSNNNVGGAVDVQPKYQNFSFPPLPDAINPYPYYFLTSQPMPSIHSDMPHCVAFQPPPRYAGREPSKTFVSQYNSSFTAIEKGNSQTKNDNTVYIHKNVLMNIPKYSSEADIRMPFCPQLMEVNSPNTTVEGPTMIRTPEDSYFNCTQNNPATTTEENFLNMHRTKSIPERPIYQYPQNDSVRRNFSCIQLHPDFMSVANQNYFKKDTDVSRADVESAIQEECDASSDLEATSSTESTNLSSVRNSARRNRLKKKLRSASSPRGLFKPRLRYASISRRLKSTGSQTEFKNNQFEERFLFREAILNGCEEIKRLAVQFPQLTEVVKMCEYIKDKTVKSRAQDFCFDSSEVELDLIILAAEHIKVFLSLSDSWLQTRNLFSIFENYLNDSCKIDTKKFCRRYFDWKVACRKFLECIINDIKILGERSVSTPGQDPNSSIVQSSKALTNIFYTSKADCRLTKSVSHLPPMTDCPNFKSSFRQTTNRLKWTLTDKSGMIPNWPCATKVYNDEKSYADTVKESPVKLPGNTTGSEDSIPVKITDIPQDKITLLSQIEPPFLRSQHSNSPVVDISAWFSGKAPSSFYHPAEEDTARTNSFQPQKSYSTTMMKPESPQDSAEDSQQKVYMKPGSYNVPKKKLSVATKRSNVLKAKEPCFEDIEIPRGYVITLTNTGSSMTMANKGQTELNVKIIKKNSTINEHNENNNEPENEKSEQTSKQEGVTKTGSKTMKTDKWLMTTLINSHTVKRNQHNDCKEKIEDGIVPPSRFLLPKPNFDHTEKPQEGKFEPNIKSSVSSDKSSDVETNTSNTATKSLTKSKMIKTPRNTWNSSKRQNSIGQKVSAQLDDILKKLWSLDCVEIMKHEAKSNQAIDFHKVVKQPIFLDVIVDKLKDGVYDKIEQFVHDCRKLILNSSTYFKEKDKAQLKSVNTFSEMFEKLLQENFENWNYWSYITGDPKEVNVYPELRQSGDISINSEKKKNKCLKRNKNSDFI